MLGHRAHFLAIGGHKMAIWSIWGKNSLTKEWTLYVRIAYVTAVFYFNSKLRLFTKDICEKNSRITV